MPDFIAPLPPSPHGGMISSGRLYYVVGPSGAGKDSLLDWVRPHLATLGVTVAHRYITRPADAGGENHVALSPQDFALRQARGCFALTWDSHGLRYGIGREVEAWMTAGLSVVVNGSRAALEQAAARFGEALVPVAVMVGPEALRARLTARGRETPQEIEDRLARAAAFTLSHPRLHRIDNSGALADAGAALLAVLR